MSEKVVVIGAGVIGCSIALELARAGFSVTVLDRGSAPGQGSTSASSAIIRFHYRHRDEAALAWEAGQRWARWSDYLGVSDPTGMASFIHTGLLALPGDVLDLSDAVSHLRGFGALVDELSQAEVARRFPAIESGRLGPPSLPEASTFWVEPKASPPAYWMPQCGYVDDPQLAAHNLAHAAEVSGAVFRYRNNVTAILRARGRVAGVELASGETIEAGIVVNAAGPWSASINELAGVLGDFTTSTRPLEQEVISVPAPGDFTGSLGFCVTDADFGTYFRPNAGNTVIVGGMEAPGDPLRWLDKPEDVHQDVTRATWEMQSLRLARRLNDATVPRRPRGVVGVYDVSADWIPIYDKTNLAGYYVAVGTSGHGFKQAPFVGELLARLITACESGHPHDDEPVVVEGSWSHQLVNLGHFSRLRSVQAQAAMG